MVRYPQLLSSRENEVAAGNSGWVRGGTSLGRSLDVDVKVGVGIGVGVSDGGNASTAASTSTVGVGRASFVYGPQVISAQWKVFAI